MPALNSQQKLRRDLENALKERRQELERTPAFRAVQQAQQRIEQFDAMFATTTAPTKAVDNTSQRQAKTTPKTQGRKNTAAAKGSGTGPKKTATPKKTIAAPKAKATPAKAKSKAKKQEAPAPARRTNGNRPPIVQAVAIVMGKGKMNAGQVVDALKTRDWLPNSKNPRQYMSYLLNQTKDIFEPISRGIYKVKEGVNFTFSPTSTPKNGKKANVDTALSDIGLKQGDVGPNVFASATAS